MVRWQFAQMLISLLVLDRPTHSCLAWTMVNCLRTDRNILCIPLVPPYAFFLVSYTNANVVVEYAGRVVLPVFVDMCHAA